MRLRLNLSQIEAYRATSLERSELRPAAAVVPIQRRAPEDQIVFIRRVTHLRSHPGEISFPGGSTELGDSDLRSTALRELTEEIGIAPHNVSIVGRLDQIEVGNRYVLTPFVATISPRGAFKYNPDEVQEVLRFPSRIFSDRNPSASDLIFEMGTSNRPSTSNAEIRRSVELQHAF